jgi:GH3 auxin-responsive promoter
MGKLVYAFVSIQKTHLPTSSPGRNPAQALVIVQERLQQDVTYKKYCDDSYTGDPTIRILKPGTFKEYRQWKGDTSSISSGQIKVPTMLTDPVAIDWLANRVVLEV